VAVGDSMSIDYYTGVDAGGAASQLARKLGFELVDLTLDGNTTQGVLADLAQAPSAADVVTLTAGGNDLLGGEEPDAILRRLHQIAARLEPLGARIVVSTVYDPSDGDDEVGQRELGLPPRRRLLRRVRQPDAATAPTASRSVTQARAPTTVESRAGSTAPPQAARRARAVPRHPRLGSAARCCSPRARRRAAARAG
jgi:GDSL-like Lipase/Acylhydrolase family